MIAEESRRQSRFGCALSFLIFRLVPLILVVAIVWTGWQVLAAVNTTAAQSGRFEERQDDYAATATALAVPGVAQSDRSYAQLVQFATNTPEADLVEPTAVPDTPVAASTQSADIPTLSAETIEIDLPDFVAPSSADEGMEIAGTAVPTQVPLIQRDYPLVNILLLGGDDSMFEDGTVRTDVMIIVSINTETRTVSMLNLPRDLFVYIPTPTMTRLNTVYGIGESMGWQPDGGFGLMAQTIFYNLGIRVHYYARVDFDGFIDIIDTLGGVNMAVDCAYQDYALLGGAEVPSAAVLADEETMLWTLPVGYYRMSGQEALWYVRTRNTSRDEFDRGRRQQQLLRSLLSEALENGTIQQLPSLWDQAMQVIDTNLTLDVMLSLAPIAFELDPSKIESFTMIRTYHTTPWQPPSGPFAGQAVQLPNYEPIRDLLVDFYQPPTSTRLSLSQSSIAVYNGTEKENFDLIAVERLRGLGYNAIGYGPADQQNYTDTIVIDQIGEDKGSLRNDIAHELNVSSENVQIQLDPNREADYKVVLGSNYNSCSGNVVPVE